MKEHFFDLKGYKLEGDEKIIGEGDPGVDVFEQKIVEEYHVWKCRVLELNTGSLTEGIVMADPGTSLLRISLHFTPAFLTIKEDRQQQRRSYQNYKRPTQKGSIHI